MMFAEACYLSQKKHHGSTNTLRVVRGGSATARIYVGIFRTPRLLPSFSDLAPGIPPPLLSGNYKNAGPSLYFPEDMQSRGVDQEERNVR
jgi:hypothetical protein